MKWAMIILGIASNGAASAFLKSAGGVSLKDPLALATNVKLWMAVVCFGLAFVFYAGALRYFPLNFAQPVTTAGAMVMVGLMSAFLFREQVGLHHFLGYGLLLCGIGVLALAPKGV